MLLVPLTVIIMAGGSATRMQTANADVRDKLMVPVGSGRFPFLAFQAERYARESMVAQVVIATVCRPDIQAYFSRRGPLIHVRNEAEARGTAGDLLRAAWGIRTEYILVVNGDTLVDFDLKAALQCHVDAGRDCTVVLTQSRQPDVQNLGAFKVVRGQVVRSEEADPRFSGLAVDGENPVPYSSTGAIFYRTPALNIDLLFLRGSSAERDLVPTFIERGQVTAYDNGYRAFLDNGTPERMSRFLALGEEYLLSLLGPPNSDLHV